MSARQLLGSLPLSLLAFAACGGERELPPAFEPLFGSEPKQELPNPDVPHERLPQASANFEETECASLVPDRVTQCGVVSVPAAPGSEQVFKIAVARVFSPLRQPEQEPVVYLSGGPGASSLDELGTKYGDYPNFAPLAPDRDFIFIDQRGVGESKPRLYCREEGEIDDLLDTCFSELSQDVDLNDIRTVNNATDVELVRRAFGYEKWNLLGVSYGTRLALTIMRDYPAGVRSVVLDSVVPLEVNLFPEAGASGYASLRRVFAACEAESECNAAFPNLEARLIRVVEELNEEPYQSEGEAVEGDVVVNLVFNLLYAPAGIGLVPQLIHDLAEGDFSLLELLGEAGSSSGTAFGMHLSLQCAEEMAFSTPEDFEASEELLPPALRAGLSTSAYIDYCAHWPVTPAAPSENEAVVSAVPALVMAGTYDPITPPRYAELVAENLSRSQLAVIDNESHAATVGECGTRLARDFFRSPSEPLSFDCLGSQPGFEWFSAGSSSPNQREAAEIDFREERPSAAEVAEIHEELKRRGGTGAL